MADVGKARGFFLNVSNYESDTRLKRYARWVSDCIALASQGGLSPRECPGTPITGARDYPGAWADVDAAYDTLFWRLHLKRDPQAQKHAVLDTSRNGQGGWVPKPGAIAMQRCGATRRNAGWAGGRHWPATILT
jgi:endoglucanase